MAEPPAPTGTAHRRRPRALPALGAAALLVTGLVLVDRAGRDDGPAAGPLPAVGTYDLSALPLQDRSATPTDGVRVVAEVVLVEDDEVRVGLSWTNTGSTPTVWGCDGASAPAGSWWAAPARSGSSGAWSPQTGALCRTVDDVSVVDLEPGASAADFHRFPRDATWASGPVRLVAVSADSGARDPRDVEDPDLDLVLDLGAVPPE